MPIIPGIMASQISGHLYVNSFYSIATVTASGGSNTLTFTNIPQTYTHLQLRGIGRDGRADINDALFIQFNGDTGTNYTAHGLIGRTTSPTVATATFDNRLNQTGAYTARVSSANTNANCFGAGITDILDYANTNKNKTVRTLSGYDNFSDGEVDLYSSAWYSTAAITSINILAPNGNFFANSTFALYGVA
jgi:hypothetical protein